MKLFNNKLPVSLYFDILYDFNIEKISYFFNVNETIEYANRLPKKKTAYSHLI